MKACTLDDFLKAMKPWLSPDYIRRAGVNAEGNFFLDFRDGVRNVYRIEDCTRARLDKILHDLEGRGIPVGGE